MKTDITIDELRIGNFFREKRSGTLLSVKLISIHGFDFHVVDRSKFPLPEGWEAEPISLDPSLICQLGFIDNDQYTYGVKEKDGLKLGFYSDGWALIVNGVKCGGGLKHLHELQNLYYVYAGKDLVFTEGEYAKEILSSIFR